MARAWLEPAELSLYLAMDPRDRQHACEVTQRLMARTPGASPALIAAALLHDVGKAGVPFRVHLRILAHLLPAGDPPAEPRRGGLAGALQVKRHHHAYGAAMVREVGGRERVAELVGRHHAADGDPEAALLQALDDAT